MALSAKIFHAVGGFGAGWTRAAGEDRELCDRLVSRGYRMIYAEDALVYHAHSLTLRTFWRQQFNYGRGAYRLYRIRAQRDPGRPHLEPFAFYLRMLAFPFDRTSRGKAAMLAGLLAVAQAANAAGFLGERLLKRT
jgi:GT2 family glycosyltransferase